MGTANNQTAPAPLTVAAAAHKLGVTTATIYRWLEDGALTRFPVEGDTVLVDRASVEAVLAQKAAS